jgi:hypothetical protein
MSPDVPTPKVIKKDKGADAALVQTLAIPFGL